MPRGARNAAFSVNVGSGWGTLARDLKAAGDEGKALKKELRKGITAAVKPMQADAKANVLAAPSRGTRHTGLRKAIARALKIRVSTSLRALKVRLEVNQAQLPPEQRALAARMEGAGRAWRKPLFGDTSRWYTQESHPYIQPAADKHLPRVQAAISQAVDTTIRAVERSK